MKKKYWIVFMSNRKFGEVAVNKKELHISEREIPDNLPKEYKWIEVEDTLENMNKLAGTCIELGFHVCWCN